MDEVRADYDQLEQVAGRFATQSQAIEQMMQQLRNSMEPLANGGWIGRGADAFFGEMNDLILPKCQRLLDLLNDANQVTKDISQKMQQAEEEASAPFRSGQ